jgi:hypothetical protein
MVPPLKGLQKRLPKIKRIQYPKQQALLFFIHFHTSIKHNHLVLQSSTNLNLKPQSSSTLSNSSQRYSLPWLLSVLIPEGGWQGQGW